jgi:transglutaminase-like putative cysteine protease
MNVQARYCTGYLGDIGVPPDPDPMDFSAWLEVYLGGRWYTFDARHNTTACRSHSDGTGTRRHRRRDRHFFRDLHAREFQGHYGGSDVYREAET